MKPMPSIQKCIYHLVREDLNVRSDPEYREDDAYFEGALQYIREHGLDGLGLASLEIDALVSAARRRGREEELDQAVRGFGKTEVPEDE